MIIIYEILKNLLFSFHLISLIFIVLAYSCSDELQDEELKEFNLYTLSVSASEGGSVSPKASGTYKEGSTITITATPDEGYRFERWEGSDNDDLANGCWSRPGNCRASITMNSDRDVQVFFQIKTD